MPEWILDGRPLIQVTLWDILGEIPVDMIKPINLMMASSVTKSQNKKGRKKGKNPNLFDYMAVTLPTNFVENPGTAPAR